MKRCCVFLILFTALLGLVACSAQPAEPAPPDIHYGEDMCSECGMIINEARFAAAYAASQEEGSYETFLFDDIGDMLYHMRKNNTLIGVGWWVHDVKSEEWIDATTALYVVSDQIETPMGNGIVALATQEAADEMAATFSGEILDWDKLRIERALAAHQH